MVEGRDVRGDRQAACPCMLMTNTHDTRVYIHLGASIHRASDSLGKVITSQPIATRRILVPVLPAWLEEIGRSDKGIVPEQRRDDEHVRLAILGDLLVHLGRQVGEFKHGRAKLVGGEEAWGAILLDDRQTGSKGCQGGKGIWVDH